jgi:methyl-accepting chemotaxis protein
MLDRLKLSTRILCLGVVIVVCFALTFAWIIPRMNASLYDAKYLKTRQLVESAWSVLDYYATLAKSGEYSEAEAKALAIGVIKDMRYGEDDYFWINDTAPRMIMHPMKPELDGQDLSQNADPYGKKLFIEMVSVCRNSGEGFVDYYWPKPGEDDPVSKISYVKLLPEWHWIIGSGIYLDDVKKEIATTLGIILTTTLLIALIGLGLSWFMGRSIAGPIVRITDGLDTGAEQVSSASTQLSGVSQELAEGSSQQAASIEETTASLKEVGVKSQETAALTTDADRLMNENIQKSGKALKAIMDLTEKMAQIESDSGKITRIIKTIDEIAFQTNLLALNAAVEAARAGEAGAGFAVVADEVRSLAIRATTAAHDTQELLDGIINQVVASGDAIKSVNVDFESIIESATLMGEKTDAITHAAKELSNGIVQIANSIGQIEQVTQRNAANAEESAAASEEMNAHAMEMKRFVGILSAIVDGSRSAALSHGASRRGLPLRSPLPEAFAAGNKQIAGPLKDGELEDF